MKQEGMEHTQLEICKASVYVFEYGSSGVYLGDPPVPVWGQGVSGATEAFQQATRWRWYTQLREKQHFIMAVAFG